MLNFQAIDLSPSLGATRAISHMNLDCDNREEHMRQDHMPSYLQGVKEGRSERIV